MFFGCYFEVEVAWSRLFPGYRGVVLRVGLAVKAISKSLPLDHHSKLTHRQNFDSVALLLSRSGPDGGFVVHSCIQAV